MTKETNIIKFYRSSEPYFEFSNFYRHECERDGELDKTPEHYFQCKKFEGTVWEHHVRNQFTPREAAREGRRKDLPLREDWDEVKEVVMFKGLCGKFKNQRLKTILLNTGDSILIENSPKDYYWGCGYDGTGKNRLGMLLMFLRDQLIERQSNRFF